MTAVNYPTRRRDIDDWRDLAECRGLGPDLFFDSEHADEAVAICARCPVQRHCHDYSTTTKEQYGVWGGDTSRLRTTAHRPERLTRTAGERIVAELQANGRTWITPHGLADRLGYEPNTIQKRLRRLIDAGAPIERLEGGFYRMRREVT